MVAAFGNFQVSVVTRRQLHALFRHRSSGTGLVLWFWHVVMNMFQRLLMQLCRPVIPAPSGCASRIRSSFAPRQPVHNHFAVFRQGFTDGFRGLLNRAVNKPAGVHNHHIGVVVACAPRHSPRCADSVRMRFGIPRVFRQPGRRNRFSAGA